MEREMKEQGWTKWGSLEGVAVDRPRWRSLVEALGSIQVLCDAVGVEACRIVRKKSVTKVQCY